VLSSSPHNAGLDRPHDHLTRQEAVEQLQQEAVGLRRQLADLDREHGRGAAGHLGPTVERADLGSHHLVAMAGLVEDVSQDRRVELVGDAIQVIGGEPIHTSPLSVYAGR
jgi:methionine synthase I (cobalamin-dependent)